MNNNMKIYTFTYNFTCDVIYGPAGMELKDEMMDDIIDFARKKFPKSEGFSFINIPYNGTLNVFDTHMAGNTSFMVEGKYTIVFQMSSVFNIEEDDLEYGFLEVAKNKILSIFGVRNLSVCPAVTQ